MLNKSMKGEFSYLVSKELAAGRIIKSHCVWNHWITANWQSPGCSGGHVSNFPNSPSCELINHALPCCLKMANQYFHYDYHYSQDSSLAASELLFLRSRG